MVTEITITGNGRYAGAKSNVTQYSVTEESTPAEASDSSGGAGQITFSAIEDPARFGSALLLNDVARLEDGDRGLTEGTISSLTSNNGLLTVTADSRLGRLVIDTKAPPLSGSFTYIIRQYLALGGITTNIAIDPMYDSINLAAPGWQGDLWTKIKELCVAFGAEISLVKANVVVRPMRGRRALEINNINESWTFSNTDLAQSVDIYYYNSVRRTNALVYPKGGWNSDVTVYTVDAGQRVTVNIPVDVSLESLQQPTVADSVAPNYSSTSIYCVSGNDGLPIMAAQWTADGGSLRVAIGEDGKSIDVTMVGATGATAKYAPYRIGMSAGRSDYYSSLRIVGAGVHFEQKSVTMLTGVDPATTSRKVGVVVDNIFVRYESDALNVGIDVACKWAAPRRTITINKADINKPGETNSTFNYATFDDFTAYATANSITTFNDFDTAWAGKTLKNFDDYWYNLVSDQFDYQVFGNANGARVQWRRAMYRIRSAQITDSNVTYTAEADTTISDFDTSAAGMTFANFDTSYSGLSFDDFSLIPLPNVRPEYERG